MPFGIAFSDYFRIDPAEMRRLGVLNPTLDVDVRLFIDPFLLYHSRHKEFSECATSKYEAHFSEVHRLILLSEDEGDKAWTAAEKKFKFSEARGMNGTCLGYGADSIGGRAFGKKKAKQSLAWAKQVIDLGVKDPEMFSSLPLFEEGIGADLISDMIAVITIDCIIQFNDRILGELSRTHKIPRQDFYLQNRKASLPLNPYSDQGAPIILVADDVLRSLPVMDDPKLIPAAIERNSELRDRVNAHIGNVFKTKTKRDKEYIRDRALESAAAFQTFLDMLKQLEKSNYNIHKDPDGFLAWREAAASAAAINPLQLKVDLSLPRPERINQVVVSIIDQFANLVENNRLYRVFYVDGEPRREAFAQLLFYAIAISYCDAADIGLTAEADAGVGPVDFKFNDGADSVLVEMKLSTNSKTVKGYEKQLGAYMDGERSRFGHYVVIDVGKIGEKWTRLQEINKKNSSFAQISRLHLIDGIEKLSASKRS